jgi:hypothetical protein
MTKNLRRILAGAVVAAVVAAVSVLGGVVSPASAATIYWVEKYDDHTDIVVDWFAVDDVAESPQVVLPACDSITSWFFESWVCVDWVAYCTATADLDYPGHAVRIGFYETTGPTCSVIGVG